MSRIQKKILKDGKPHYYPVTMFKGKETSLGGYRTKTEAKAVLYQAQREIAEGTYGQADPTFEELATDYLASIKLEVKASSYSDYEIQVRVHLVPYFGQKRIHGITTQDIDKFRTTKAGETKRVKRWNEETGKKEWTEVPYSSRRVNKCLTVLGAIFNFAIDKKYLRESPMRGVKKLENTTEEARCLTKEQVRRLLDASSPTLYPIVYTAIWTGLRQSELFGLKWCNVDLVNRKLKVRQAYRPQYGETTLKSRYSRRTVDLSANLVNVLMAHRAKTAGGPNDYVFRNKAGNPIDYHNIVHREYNQALNKAGIERLTWHAMRHTFASILIDRKVNIKIIQKLMGHADIGTTLNVYGHLFPDSMDGICNEIDGAIFSEDEQGATGSLVRVK
jgi:integrase